MPIWPDVVVAAGVDAARDLDLQRPDVALPVEVGEGLGDLLRHRDRARRRQRAVVHARAGDDVRDQPDVRRREPRRLQPRIDLRQVPARHVRQDEVLLVADAHLVVAELLGEVGEHPHLLGGRVARRAADRLQRHGDDGVVRRACARRRWCRPRRAARRRASGGSGAAASKAGGAKAASISATSSGFTGRIRALFADERRLDPLAHRLERRSSCTRIFSRALYLLSRRPQQVVDLQDRLEVGQQVRLRQELPHHLADHRRPAEAAADA